MRGYAESEAFSTEEIEVFRKAGDLVEGIPDGLGREVRCHELARAVGERLRLPVADGWYGMVEHSWLWTREPRRFASVPNILDVYAPGRLPQVILVHSSNSLPFEYRRGDRRKDVRKDVLEKLRKFFQADRG